MAASSLVTAAGCPIIHCVKKAGDFVFVDFVASNANSTPLCGCISTLLPTRVPACLGSPQGNGRKSRQRMCPSGARWHSCPTSTSRRTGAAHVLAA